MKHALNLVLQLGPEALVGGIFFAAALVIGVPYAIYVRLDDLKWKRYFETRRK